MGAEEYTIDVLPWRCIDSLEGIVATVELVLAEA